MKEVERMLNWKAHNAVCCRERVTPLPWETFKIMQGFLNDNQNVVNEAVELAKKVQLKKQRRLSTFIPAKKRD